MVKDFILAKVLYSFQWTWTFCCLADINLAVSMWMISVSLSPKGTVCKSEQWHQFPNRLNTMTCLTYKALSNLTVVKVPAFWCLMWLLFSFSNELQSKHWSACILYVKSPMEKSLPCQPHCVSWELVCHMYRRNQLRFNYLILTWEVSTFWVIWVEDSRSFLQGLQFCILSSLDPAVLPPFARSPSCWFGGCCRAVLRPLYVLEEAPFHWTQELLKHMRLLMKPQHKTSWVRPALVVSWFCSLDCVAWRALFS